MDTQVKTPLAVAEELLGPLSGEEVRRILEAGQAARYNAVYHTKGVPALTGAQLDQVQRTGEINMVADMLYDKDAEERRLRKAGVLASVSGGAPDPDLRPKPPIKEPHGTTRLTLTINTTHYQVRKVDCQEASASHCYELRKAGPKGAVYHISQHAWGAECDCPDFIFRKEGSAVPCKHLKAASVFGLIDADPAVAKSRPKAPEAAPVKMTREALTSGKVRHPFDLAGLGPGPFICFATLRNLDSEITRKSAAQMKVGIEACAACRLPSDTLYVVEGLSGRRHAVCPTCIAGSGDGGLIRRMKHEEHERRRLLDSISTDRRRR
jgi:hypothetical protein